MSDLQAAIDTLTAEGFVAGLKTPEGRFYHRGVNSEDEIDVHVTSRTFPADQPGMNIWLQVSRNARPKYREDVLLSETNDPASEMLDRIAGLEAFSADTTDEAIAIIHRRLGGAYSPVSRDTFPLEDHRAHKDYRRVKEYLEAQRRRLAAAMPPRQVGGEIPDLQGKVTPGKIHMSSEFRLANVRPGVASYERLITQATQRIAVTHVSNFDPTTMPATLEAEGYVVCLYDESAHGITFSHRIPEDEVYFVDQERAFMLAAAVEASRKSFVADGAEFLANYLTGETSSERVVNLAFDMVHEDIYEDLGAGDDELLWWQFLDDLHERTYGFSYEVENFMKMKPEIAPAI